MLLHKKYIFWLLNRNQWNKQRKYVTSNLVGKICDAEYISKQIKNAMENNVTNNNNNGGNDDDGEL